MQTFDQEWEIVHNTRTWGRYPSEDVIRFVARHRPRSNNENVTALDAGCGVGSVLWLLAREGFHAYGFDGSRSAVAKAKTFLDQERLVAQVLVCDAARIEFSEAFFDVAIDNGMLGGNSVEGIHRILWELRRVLKPGGKLFSTRLFTRQTSGFGSGERVEKDTFRNLEFGPLARIGTIHFFDKEFVRQTWEETGFRIQSIDRELRTINGGAQQIEFLSVESVKA